MPSKKKKQARRSEKNLIEVIDNDGRTICATDYRIVFEKKVLRKCAHAIILNKSGELLLELRNSKRQFFPNTWNSSSSGFLQVGETAKHAAERELREELGVKAKLKLVGKFFVKEANDNSLNFLFVARLEGPFDCNEAECLRFFPYRVAKKLKKTPQLRNALRLLKSKKLV